MASLAICSALPAWAAACGGEDPGAVGSSVGTAVEEDATPRDGQDALRMLLEGNARFAEDRSERSLHAIRRHAALVEEQHPVAAVLGCADSRVPPELVFDASLGDLFVIRVAGNVVADDEAGSVEYAVDHLDVPLVVVLGHEGCGAVTAAVGRQDEEPEELSRLLQRLEPGLAGIDPALPMEKKVHQGVEANVRESVRRLQAIVEREDEPGASPVLIVGAVYELETGRIRLLE